MTDTQRCAWCGRGYPLTPDADCIPGCAHFEETAPTLTSGGLTVYPGTVDIMAPEETASEPGPAPIRCPYYNPDCPICGPGPTAPRPTLEGEPSEPDEIEKRIGEIARTLGLRTQPKRAMILTDHYVERDEIEWLITQLRAARLRPPSSEPTKLAQRALRLAAAVLRLDSTDDDLHMMAADVESLACQALDGSSEPTTRAALLTRLWDTLMAYDGALTLADRDRLYRAAVDIRAALACVIAEGAPEPTTDSERLAKAVDIALNDWRNDDSAGHYNRLRDLDTARSTPTGAQPNG